MKLAVLRAESSLLFPDEVILTDLPAGIHVSPVFPGEFLLGVMKTVGIRLVNPCFLGHHQRDGRRHPRHDVYPVFLDVRKRPRGMNHQPDTLAVPDGALVLVSVVNGLKDQIQRF